MIDISPLRKSRDCRFRGDSIPGLQPHGLDRGGGAIGLVQVGPMVIAGLYGGSLADLVERRKILLWTEIGLLLCTLILALNASLASPSVPVVFALAALSSLLCGLHRPFHEALTPRRRTFSML